MLSIADKLHWDFIEITLNVEGLYEVVSEVYGPKKVNVSFLT